MNQNVIDLLMDIGFTKLQSRVYLLLQQSSQLTGYKISQTLDEPVANTYKALATMQKKGIVLLDESASMKSYSALPIDQYLNQLERNFQNKKASLINEMKKMKAKPLEEGIFRIDNIDQLYEMASKTILETSELVALDASPLPLTILRDELKKAAKRKVKVLLKIYSDIKIPGCDIVRSMRMGSPVTSLPIQYFHLVVPGQAYLAALLDIENKHIIQAIFCKSLFLSLIAYNGFGAEFFLTSIFDNIQSDPKYGEIMQVWEAFTPYRPGNLKATRNLISILPTDDLSLKNDE